MKFCLLIIRYISSNTRYANSKIINKAFFLETNYWYTIIIWKIKIEKPNFDSYNSW
jgi:hypothetical protein